MAKAGKMGPPDKRRCVRFGLAYVNQEGKLFYNWEEILRAWQLWPSTNLSEFCSHFDLVYRVVQARAGYAPAEKRALLDDANARYRRMVVGRAVIASFQDPSQDIESLRSDISDLRQTTSLASKYVRGKLSKLTGGGQLAVNMAMPVAEVRSIMEIVYRAASTLAQLVQLRDLTNDKGDADGMQTDLRPTQVSGPPQLKLAQQEAKNGKAAAAG